MSSDFGVYGNPAVQSYHIFRTVLKVDWTVSDDVSFIERQYLSVQAHVGGEFSISPVQVCYVMTGPCQMMCPS